MKSVFYRNNISGERQQREKSRSQYTLDSNGDLGSDLYYNSRPESRYHQTSTVSSYYICIYYFTPFTKRHIK